MARAPTDTIRFLTLDELGRLFAATRASARPGLIVAARAGPDWPGPANIHLTDASFSLVSQAVNH